MPTYTAHFQTEAEHAFHDFEADTPAQALQMARDLWERGPDALAFESYDMLMPIDEIEISGPEGTELAVWLSDYAAEASQKEVSAPDGARAAGWLFKPWWKR